MWDSYSGTLVFAAAIEAYAGVYGTHTDLERITLRAAMAMLSLIVLLFARQSIWPVAIAHSLDLVLIAASTQL